MKVVGYNIWAAIAFSALSSAAHSDLSTQECSLISSYEMANGEGSFSRLVSHMSHDVELCHLASGCDFGLRKRTSPVSITLNDRSDSEYRDVFNRSAAYALNRIGEASGLEFLLNAQEGSPNGLIHIILVDKDNRAGQRSWNPELFHKFLNSNRLTCLVANFDWLNSKVEYSEVWIKTSIGKRKFSDCVKEELYNASGVPGDPPDFSSLFSQERYSSIDLDSLRFREYFPEDLLVLKILYSDKMKIGQSRAVTEMIARKYIVSICEGF